MLLNNPRKFIKLNAVKTKMCLMGQNNNKFLHYNPDLLSPISCDVAPPETIGSHKLATYNQKLQVFLTDEF